MAQRLLTLTHPGPLPPSPRLPYEAGGLGGKVVARARLRRHQEPPAVARTGGEAFSHPAGVTGTPGKAGSSWGQRDTLPAPGVC